MATPVKAVYEDGVFKPKEPVALPEHTEVEVYLPVAVVQDGEDPTGWKAMREFIGMWKDAPEGEPIARDHDKYLYGFDE